MNPVKYLKRGDEYFPEKLEFLKDCPDILYVLGNEKILKDFSIAVIGARICSREGREIARNIAKELASQKINIISGLAIGIDSVAHEECINARWKTVAVLGGGFKNIYPKENIKLCKQIIENGGAIISEYPPDDAPLGIKFRKRNRIIAALSDGVTVIEARKNSGSLVTVKYARELNKKIFVVPGNLYDVNYDGSNNLIVEGEKCVRNSNDILKYYPEIQLKMHDENKPIEKQIEISNDLKEVYDVLNKRGKNIEEICERLNCNAKYVLSKLTILEMQGVIVQYPGKRFAKK